MTVKYDTKTSVQIERDQHKTLVNWSEKTGRTVSSLLEESLRNAFEKIMPADLAYAEQRMQMLGKKGVVRAATVAERKAQARQ